MGLKCSRCGADGAVPREEIGHADLPFPGHGNYRFICIACKDWLWNKFIEVIFSEEDEDGD